VILTEKNTSKVAEESYSETVNRTSSIYRCISCTIHSVQAGDTIICSMRSTCGHCYCYRCSHVYETQCRDRQIFALICQQTVSASSSLSSGDHAAGHPPIACEIVLHQQLMMMRRMRMRMSAGGLDDLCECCSRCEREHSAAAKAL